MEPSTLYDAAQHFGPSVAMIGFFIWWAYVREKALGRRLDKMVDQHTEMSTVTIANNTAAMKENTVATKELREEISRWRWAENVDRGHGRQGGNRP